MPSGYNARMPTLDFWFDFASTYSYPAALRIAPLAAEAGVTLRWRPFLLGPIFKAQGWDNSPFNLYPVKGAYMWRDLERLCASLDLPFKRPPSFPQHSIMAARVALAALEQGWGDDFCRAVYRREFGNGADIGSAEAISEIIGALGRAAGPVIERAQSDEIKTRLRAQTDEAQRRGIFGAPSFVTADGELFWGNDRLEAALAWAKR